MILNPSIRDPAAKHPVVKRITKEEKGRRNFFIVNPIIITKSRSVSLRIVFRLGKKTRDPTVKRNNINGSIETAELSTITPTNESKKSNEEASHNFFSSLGVISFVKLTLIDTIRRDTVTRLPAIPIKRSFQV